MWSYTFFPKLLNMSLTGSVVIIAVLLGRLALRKAPRIYSYVLWSVVLFRLLCPVSVSGPVSVLGIFDSPAAAASENTTVMTYIPEDIVHTEYPAVDLPVPAVSQVINENLPQGREQLGADPLEFPVSMATLVWLLGLAGMAGCSLGSLIRLRAKLREAVHLRENVYMADRIESPFVIGLLRPRIYLPSRLSEGERDYIMLHERFHIRRGDHWVKALSYAALCLHWFNPLAWVAFLLSGRDMEMSCDEAVLKTMGEEIRCDYSASLLSFATGRRIIAGAPLAFGEGDTGSRIRHVLRWKKPRRWFGALAAVLCAALLISCAVNPEEEPGHAPEPFCHSYRVEEIVYDAPQYSFTYTPETAPLFSLSSDYAMFVLEDKDSESWLNPGSFRETELTVRTFDECFRVKCPEEAVTWREENEAAWRLDVGEGDGRVFYYLLLQENGDVYLTYGHRISGSEDSWVIRWGFKLARTDTLELNVDMPGKSLALGLGWFDLGQVSSVRIPSTVISDSATLRFRAEGDDTTLVVHEELYESPGGEPVYNTHTLERNPDGEFLLEIRAAGQYGLYTIERDGGVYVVRIDFRGDELVTETEAPLTGREYVFDIGVNGAQFGLELPAGWEYQRLEYDESAGTEGIRIWPAEYPEGYIDLQYHAYAFGVCGTGLEEETVTLNSGKTVVFGIYDGGPLWSYAVLDRDFTAWGTNMELWWDEYEHQVMEILDSAWIDGADSAE